MVLAKMAAAPDTDTPVSSKPDRGVIVAVGATKVPERVSIRTSDRRYRARLITLRKRSEFQRLRGGIRWSGAAFVMEGKPPVSTGGCPATTNATRFGFTITKKIGNAVARNRMRRRLSHALRTLDVPAVLIGWDIVIVARRPALDVPFETLLRDFKTALSRLAHKAPGKPNKTGL